MPKFLLWAHSSGCGFIKGCTSKINKISPQRTQIYPPMAESTEEEGEKKIKD